MLPPDTPPGNSSSFSIPSWLQGSWEPKDNGGTKKVDFVFTADKGTLTANGNTETYSDTTYEVVESSSTVFKVKKKDDSWKITFTKQSDGTVLARSSSADKAAASVVLKKKA